MSEVAEAPAPRMMLPMGKIGMAIGAFETGKRVRNEVREYWRQNYAWTVSVSEADQLYSDVHAWLLSIMPTEKQRTLLVSSKKNGARYQPVEDDDSSPGKVDALKIRFDDAAERDVEIHGHKIKVWLTTPDPSQSSGFGMREPKKIKFQAATHAGQQAVVNELNRIHTEKAGVRKPTLKMVSSWGDWTTRSDLPERTMESVCMPEEQKKRIIADLGRFLEAEPRYNTLSIPWHRGYMFHGPPGTGKTSFVKALANHFDLDLWYVGLADLRTENSLMNLIGSVGSRSILLLEDIDTMKITQDDGDASNDSSSVTIGSLLNALDGVATPHGLITMMTTNHFDTLDHRLIRAGRMDVVEKLDWPTYSTLKAMFEMFYAGAYTAWSEDAYTDLDPIVGVSPAQFAEIFKNNLDDPWTARDQVNDLITEFRVRD